MKTYRILVLSAMLSILPPALGQHPGTQPRPVPRSAAPPPPRPRSAPYTAPQVEHHPDGTVDRTPHFRDGHWYGHDLPNDPRYRLQHPFDHGRFSHFGPTWQYKIVRIDRIRRFFWLPGGFYFQIAPWDWPWCDDWCWDCGDDFVVYLDPDHPGWYLLYNLRTGVYVHVLYMGPD